MVKYISPDIMDIKYNFKNKLKNRVWSLINLIFSIVSLLNKLHKMNQSDHIIVFLIDPIPADSALGTTCTQY